VRKLIIGLTGGIGAGKSAVAGHLAALGAVVIDADQLARDVVAPGTDGLAAVVDAFGPEVLDGSGALDRRALGGVVFHDPQARKRLEAIIHPRVRARTAEMIEAAPAGAVIVNDVPLLAEAGLASGHQLVIVVEASPEIRLRRLVDERGLAEDEARSRMAAQATDEQRRAVADVVIVNDGSMDELHRQIDKIWRDTIAPAAAETTGQAPA
jgi:dephospho-CoA kinase